MINHTPDKLLDFWRQGLALGQALKFLAQTLTLQGFTPIGMRRPTLRIVPRRRRAIADRFTRLTPRPQLHQRMHPSIYVERPHIGPDVAHLLLAQSLDLFQVMEVLLNTETLRRHAQDLLCRHRGVGAEQRQPTVFFPHDHHADAAPGWPPSRLEGLDPLDADRAVLTGTHLLPATRLPRTLGQADPPRTVQRLSAPSPMSPPRRHGHGAQRRITAQATDDRHLGNRRRLEERPLGIEAIDHHTEVFSRQVDAAGGPADQRGRQLQLGTERPALARGKAWHVLASDVPEGAKVQAERAPQGMVDDPGQRDPDVAVEELLVGRSRGGVVVQAGTLDVRSVA